MFFIFFRLGSKKTPILALCLILEKDFTTLIGLSCAYPMQNISSLALKFWELLNAKVDSRQFFNHISSPRQKFKNLVRNFFWH